MHSDRRDGRRAARLVRAPRRRSAIAAVAAALALCSALSLIACAGDAPTAPKKVAATARVVAGAGVTDTILAAPVQAVVVEVRDTLGRLVPGALVRFRVRPTTVPGRAYETPLFVCTLQQVACGPESYASATTFAVDTTRADGLASAMVRLGSIAGPAWLDIRVPELGVEDSAQFTVLPGKVGRIVLSVADTAVTVGSQFTLTGTLQDRYGNAVAGTTSYAAGSDNLTISANGLVTAVAAGRGTLLVSGGGHSSQAYVSVLPSGTIVASGWDGVYVVNLDGTGRRRVVQRSPYSDSFAPTWSPDGSRIVFHAAQPTSGQNMVYVADASASDAQGTPLPETSVVSSGWWPRYSADGAYVYFSGRPVGGCCSLTLYRVRADGTQTEALSPYSESTIDWRSSPSPDGSKLVYVTSRIGGAAIRIFDVATRTMAGPDVYGQTPRWSPDGTRIAYVPAGGGALYLMNADGTNPHVLTSDMWFSEGMDWSPDGRWIVANAGSWMAVVSATTGEVMPVRLNGLIGLSQPSWKP